MFDASQRGVLYTEHSSLTAGTPIASLWSYETCARGPNRHSVALNLNGDCEYWLDRSDPLLNTILPGTGVSLIVNVGDTWAAGRSLVTSEVLPRVCVAGPVTQPRILHVGQSVQCLGAAFSAAIATDVFAVRACELVDRIVALEDLWTREEAHRLLESLWRAGPRHALRVLKGELMIRIRRQRNDFVRMAAPHIITRHRGRVSINGIARAHGMSRQEFARQFRKSAGLPPKLFARITRFQALVHTLLATDASQWASLSTEIGFYDQAHMINEFRNFAGAPPTVFFQPRGASAGETPV